MTPLIQAPPERSPEFSLRRSDYPALYQSASQASRQGQRWRRRFVVANLGLLVSVAVLSAADFPVLGRTANAFIAALIVVGMFGAMAVTFVDRYRRDDKNWFDGRAVAESVKTASWRYMMRTEPFGDDATCDVLFAQRLRAIQDARKELRQELGAMSIDPHQITARMREVRRLGVRRRRDFYVRERLDTQISWYRRQSRLNGHLAERWFWASFGAEFVGLTIAIWTLALLQDDDTRMALLNLTGVAAALAVAFTAWTQLGRHNELNRSYGLAWQELLTIKDLAAPVNTELGLQDFVHSGEDAISREHTMWVAKRE